MKAFWRYFKDTLAWPLIRGRSALAAVAEGAAGSLDLVLEHILWLRRQFNPATCDMEHVAHYARARGITRHHLETDGQFRARVVNAYAWQLLGGRQAGLPLIIAHFGYAAAKIINMRQTDPDRWAEFRVEIESARAGGMSVDDYELLDWVLNDQKPARSKLAGIRYTARVSGPLRIAAAMHGGELVTIYPYAQALAGVSGRIVSFGAAHQVVETVMIYPEVI